MCNDNTLYSANGIALLTILIPFAALTPRSSLEADELSDVVHNIRLNELLFADFDCKYTKEWRLQTSPIPDVLDSSQLSAHSVFQGKKHHLSLAYSEVSADGPMTRVTEVQEYDGERGRLLQNNFVGNIHHNRVIDPRMVRPHMIALVVAGEYVTQFSEFFINDNEQGVEKKWKHLGRATEDGLTCDRLRCEWLEPDGTLVAIDDWCVAMSKNDN